VGNASATPEPKYRQKRLTWSRKHGIIARRLQHATDKTATNHASRNPIGKRLETPTGSTSITELRTPKDARDAEGHSGPNRYDGFSSKTIQISYRARKHIMNSHSPKDPIFWITKTSIQAKRLCDATSRPTHRLLGPPTEEYQHLNNSLTGFSNLFLLQNPCDTIQSPIAAPL